ncbi:MAG TPA: hypothetical protein VGJ89_10450 [Geothrix sp.]
MNWFIITIILLMPTQMEIKSKIYFPSVQTKKDVGYILYIYQNLKINCYFLIERDNQNIVFMELNSNHDSGESWLDINENEIRQHFNLSKNVYYAKEISGLPFSIQEIATIQRSKVGAIFNINGKGLQVYRAYKGFVFLKSTSSNWKQ